MKLFRLTESRETNNFLKGEVPVFNFSHWKLDSRHPDFETSRLERELKDFSCDKNFGLVVGTPRECEIAAERCRLLYLPGEVSRQADVLEAARKTRCELLVERGAFLTPRDMLLVAPKLSGAHFTVVESGSHFGYGDRVLDIRAFSIYQQARIDFALNLSELLAPRGETSRYEPAWVHDEHFVESFINVARSFSTAALCYLDFGPGKLDGTKIVSQMGKR